MVSLLAIYFLLLSSSSSPIVFVLNCVDAFYAGREKKSDSFLYSCSARQHITPFRSLRFRWAHFVFVLHAFFWKSPYAKRKIFFNLMNEKIPPRQHSKQSSSIFTQDAISYGYISTAKYWLIYPIIYLHPLNNASLKAILLSGACVAYCMGFAWRNC